MGTVIKTIGTSSRDYSTLQAWEDALPVDLVGDGNAQVGECYADSEFTSTSNLLTIAGHTVDSTNFITLRCAAGQSFRDHASVLTSALRYDASKGVALRTTGSGYLNHSIIDSNTPYTVIDGLQYNEATNNGFGAVRLIEDNTIKNCLGVVSVFGRNTTGVLSLGRFTSNPRIKAINMVTMCHNGAGISLDNSGLHVIAGCTVVKFSDAPDYGTQSGLYTGGAGHYAGSNIVINTAVFGFGNFSDDNSSGQWGAPSGNNCTDAASAAGSSNQTSKTYSSQFENIVQSTADMRAKAGGSLLDNGQTDSTYNVASDDIARTSRPQGAAWDIGAWELIAATAAGSPWHYYAQQ